VAYDNLRGCKVSLRTLRRRVVAVEFLCQLPIMESPTKRKISCRNRSALPILVRLWYHFA